MKRTVIILASVLSFLGMGYSFYYFGIRPSNDKQFSLWLVFGPSLLLLVAAVVFLIWACSDNIYQINSGLVVNHRFVPAHMQPAVYIPGIPGTGTSPGTQSVYIPAHWVPDDWSIQLRDEQGRTGWIHFSSDVLDTYPIGSHYTPEP